jgi:valyl-tRNA synthetase
MDNKFLSPYKPDETEDRIYSSWLESGFFNPDECVKKGFTKSDAETFAIVLPPPNVTGVLHMGHAAMLAIEDIVVRYQRMQGKRTLWLPGTDHAAIATQSKVEKLLEKEEKLSRRDLGREEFLKRVEKFAQESHDTIVHQVRKLGSSVDWSREAFTLDEARSHAVRTAFLRMYEDGLIVQKYRVVNWDPKGQTVISDDEIIYEERKATLYTFK